MTCAELNGLLDRLMDGELTGGERAALEAHGRECAACAEAIRATLQMKALFDEMEPEADVPLDVQAKWRGAVREEARRQRGRRLARWIGPAAAAVVVLVGVGLALNGGIAPRQNASLRLATTETLQEAVEADEAAVEARAAAYGAESESDSADVAVVGTDGAETAVEAEGETAVAAPPADAESGAVSENADVPVLEYESFDSAAAAMDDGAEAASEVAPMRAALAQRAPACEVAIQVEDVEVACGVVSDLADEFEGHADVQRVEDGSANVYVELDAESAGAFFSAVLKLDASQAERSAPELPEAGTVLVLLVVNPVE